MTRYSYQSTQFDIAPLSAIAQRIRAFQLRIAPDDLYSDMAQGIEGLEREQHVTVLYGIAPAVSVEALRAAISTQDAVTITLGETTLFAHDAYDVLKIDIVSPALHALHTLLRRSVGAPGNSYPTYQPHLTLAYLKQGRGKRYCGASFQGLHTTFATLTVSRANGEKASIDLQPPSTAKSLRIDHNLSRDEATGVAVGLALNGGDPQAVIEALNKADPLNEGPLFAGEEDCAARVAADFDAVLGALVAATTGLTQDVVVARIDPQFLWLLTKVLRSRSEEVLLRNVQALIDVGYDPTRLDEIDAPTSLPFPLRGIEAAFAQGQGVAPTQPARGDALEGLVLPRAQMQAQQLIDLRLAKLPQALVQIAQPILQQASLGGSVKWTGLAQTARRLFGYDEDWDRFALTEVRFAYSTGHIATLADPYVRFLVSDKACRDCKRLLKDARVKTDDLWRTIVATQGYQPRGAQNWRVMVPLHPRCSCAPIGVQR